MKSTSSLRLRLQLHRISPERTNRLVQLITGMTQFGDYITTVTPFESSTFDFSALFTIVLVLSVTRIVKEAGVKIYGLLLYSSCETSVWDENTHHDISNFPFCIEIIPDACCSEKWLLCLSPLSDRGLKC